MVESASRLLKEQRFAKVSKFLSNHKKILLSLRGRVEQVLDEPSISTLSPETGLGGESASLLATGSFYLGLFLIAAVGSFIVGVSISRKNGNAVLFRVSVINTFEAYRPDVDTSTEVPL